MSVAFNARRGLVLVSTELFGPSGSMIVTLALDTGATGTLVNQSRLMQIGYDPAAQTGRQQITTGSGIEFVPRLTISRIDALGQSHTSFPVLCHTLPPSAGVDGLLGLDFLRNHELLLDFRTGQIELR